MTPSQPSGFKCSHCKVWVPINETMGTHNRNHCPNCLWSQHLDAKIPGDRASTCSGGMPPIGLTFKAEGLDRYGKTRQGELMLIHECQACHKVSLNRIAADDQTEMVMKVFEESLNLPDQDKLSLANQAIQLLSKDDIFEVQRQLGLSKIKFVNHGLGAPLDNLKREDYYDVD